MIPNTYRLNSYDSVPVLTESQLNEIIKNGHQLVCYDELVIDLTGFNHPGNSLVFQPFINNLSLNTKHQFKKYNHSQYAELIITQRTIGKLTKQTNSFTHFQGKALFEKVQQDPLFNLHQNSIAKIDFSKPIWDQINQLKNQEKQALTKVPTHILSGKQVVFKENPIQDLWYSTNFWVSNLTFQACILATFVYLLIQSETNLNLLQYLPFFIIGILKWTLIQYYFHRFLLHYNIADKSFIDHHLMHHAFPQIRGKIAVSIHKVGYYMVGFYLFYSLFLEKFVIIVLLMGLLAGLTMYDMLHYYFHFGPQCKIGWVNRLKRQHLKHHYRNPDKGFGVSNTLWDSFFKTLHQQDSKN